MAWSARSAAAPSIARLDTRQSDDAILYLPIEGGVGIAVRNDLADVTTYVLTEQGDWYEPELDFLRRLVEPGMRVIDGGAGHGVYTLSLAKAAGPRGQVVAIEPAARRAEFLAAGVGYNRLENVEICRAALSDWSGRAPLYRDRSSQRASLEPSFGTFEQQAAVTTLDELWQELARPQLDLVKLDLDGGELDALTGASMLLERQSPLFMVDIDGCEERARRLSIRLRHHGYGTYRLLPGLNALAPFDLSRFSPFEINLFACRPDRARQLARRGLLLGDAQSHESAASEDLRRIRDGVERLPVNATRLRDGAIAADWAHQNPDHAEALAWAGSLLVPSMPVAERYTSLIKACTAIHAALDRHEPAGCYARYATVARATLALGERELALEMLAGLTRLLEPATVICDLPFLPPLAAFDSLDAEGRWEEWASVVVIDALVQYNCHSTRFTRGEALPALERWRDSPFFGRHLERRRQLLRIRQGIQETLMPNRKLDDLPHHRPNGSHADERHRRA